MISRPMEPTDEPHVRALHARCHPDQPQREPFFYFACPTLVVARAADLAGFASFILMQMAAGQSAMLGADLCVHPDLRGQGIGRQLFADRLHVARAIGAATFIGYTQPENVPMIRLFESFGMKPVSTHPTQGVAYAGAA